MRGKKAIERFIQLVFSVWAALLLIELENEGEGGMGAKTLGEMVNKIRISGIVDLVKEILDWFDLSYLDGRVLDRLQRIGFKS